jgi:hypothetical protein
MTSLNEFLFVMMGKALQLHLLSGQLRNCFHFPLSMKTASSGDVFCQMLILGYVVEIGKLNLRSYLVIYCHEILSL